MEIKKLLYSMGEVSEMFDVNPSLIRYWESQFDVLRPKKNKKGNRLFTPEDVQMLKLIYHLVKEQGMTLEGAKRSLKQNRGSVARDSELLERLQRVRALLVEVREDLKAGDGDLLIGDGTPAVSAPAEGPASDPEGEEEPAAEEERSEQPLGERKRRRVRRPSEVQEKELFAFYEQSLFRSYED
ncbi:MerR family transcriptional regulator [uncultured Alistipes sp.]|uniref:MerR family transcriptional regulator n=1 Tax=uncultured Alistipes sp. TaxID=538949 RepID=UPI0025DEA87F|nr:MerR family transcriptional regulator [uncultured Alistipes sp.]